MINPQIKEILDKVLSQQSNKARELHKKSLEQRQQQIVSTQEEDRQHKQEEDRQHKEEGTRKQELALHLAEARKLVQENDFDKAIQAYHKILADHQGHPEAHFGLSRAYKGQQNWEAALNPLQWLADRYPHKAQVHADLGDVYLFISKALCQESSSTGADRTDRTDRAASPMIADAFQAYKKAIEADKKFIHLYLKMATICIHLGNLDEAIQHYEDYLNLNPGDYHSLVKLGDCYLMMGARDAAKIGYQGALRIHPNYSPAMERINRFSL